MTGDAYRLSMELLRDSVREAPGSFDLCGRTFTLLDGVFSPADFPSTGIFTAALPLTPGASVLEVGCGAGVTVVVAAARGCSRVVGVDINPRAVENTRRNIAAHGLGDRASARESDLFGAVAPEERFDLVYWNSSFVLVDGAYEFRDPLERAFFDPGYAAHRRYLREAPRHLTSSGRLLLGFSDLGDLPLLGELAEQAGLRLLSLHEELSVERSQTVRYMLLEAVPAAAGTEHSSEGDEAG